MFSLGCLVFITIKLTKNALNPFKIRENTIEYLGIPAHKKFSKFTFSFAEMIRK